VAVKLTPLTVAPLTLTLRFTGLKLYPVFAGVTKYVPLAKLAKL